MVGVRLGRHERRGEILGRDAGLGLSRELSLDRELWLHDGCAGHSDLHGSSLRWLGPRRGVRAFAPGPGSLEGRRQAPDVRLEGRPVRTVGALKGPDRTRPPGTWSEVGTSDP